MQLFKRILLSFFPQSMISQNINPASMFISFISAKQFFPVVNRKIIENYKLNLFDISLDSFDVKIGFGDAPTIKLKDIDFYYSYGCVANFNGYKFYGVSNMASVFALLSAIYFRKNFNNITQNYFMELVVSVYLLSFVFASRLKVFPYQDDKQNYTFFVEVFFSFYKSVLTEGGYKIDEKYFFQLKNELLVDHMNVFFTLYHFYKKINNIFDDKIIDGKEFYNRFFYDELKKGNHKFLLMDFVENYELYIHSTDFATTQRKILHLVFPADILIRYIFDSEDYLSSVENILLSVYDKDILDKYTKTSLKSDQKFDELVEYIFNHNHFKKNFFGGIKKHIVHKFKTNPDFKDSQDEIDDFLSQVGENEDLKDLKIPDRIKKESVMMEKFINFYVSFIGGFRISRGDNFYMRIFRKNIIDEVMSYGDIFEMKQESLFFYGGLLYNYSKNVFYYKYAFENVRSGKEKFNLPFRATFKEVYSNPFILKLFDENFISNILQDINSKDIKLYIQNKPLMAIYKEKLGQKILSLIKYDDEKFIRFFYSKIAYFLKDIPFDDIVYNNMIDKDILNLKENIYTLDMWLFFDFLDQLKEIDMDINNKYSDFSILGIMSIARDTLFGFLFYLKYLSNKYQETNIDHRLKILKKIYIIDILGLGEEYLNVMDDILEKIELQYDDIFDIWINLDDNKHYLQLGAENWIAFVQDKSDEKIFVDIAGEDLIWLRGFLKTITFYNKRFIIPKE